MVEEPGKISIFPVVEYEKGEGKEIGYTLFPSASKSASYSFTVTPLRDIHLVNRNDAVIDYAQDKEEAIRKAYDYVVEEAQRMQKSFLEEYEIKYEIEDQTERGKIKQSQLEDEITSGGGG